MGSRHLWLWLTWSMLLCPVLAHAQLSFDRIPWEGGPAYWAQFPKANAAGWDGESFFPIAVFLSAPIHATALQTAGINTYMGIEHTPPLTTATDTGMFVFPQQEEWTTGEVGTNANALGWFILDECDQGEGVCGGMTDSERLAFQQAIVDTVRARNDGRFTWANYGNGILRTFWAVDLMDDYVQMVEGSSADKYTYTSPGVRDIIDGVHDAPDWPNGTPVERAYSYGWQVDQMRRFQHPASLRPIWAFVESARPLLNETGARAILPDEIEGAVWSSLIHEARGVAYFQHNNATSGCTAFYSIVDCPTVNATVTAINAKIASLAPVLNTQSWANSTRTVNGFVYDYFTFSNGTDTMLKTYNGYAYIFAALGMGHSTGSKTFTVPAGIENAPGTSVEVVGESRTLTVSDGAFTDTFAQEYTHHVYKIVLAASATTVTPVLRLVK